MPRTVDTAAHATRADAFIDVAQRLIQTQGYERMSIQDVLDAAGASRGAFYHYFESKEALLDAVILRITENAIAASAPVADDPSLGALEKLRRVFGAIGQWKLERSDLMRAILETWFSDENAVVREKFRRRLVGQLGPLFSRIVGQGQAEGVFSAGPPDAIARVLVSLVTSVNDAATELYIARHAGRVTVEEVEAILFGYFTAFERVLGIPAGSMAVADPRVIREFYA